MGDGFFGAAHEYIRLDTGFEEFFDGVLGGFCFQLSGGFQVRNERKMNDQKIFNPEIPLGLTHGFDKGKRFNVAHRSADLGNDHIKIPVFPQGIKILFDLIGNVRYHLDGFPQESPFPLFRDHIVVDPARCHVVGLGGVDVEKAFVMAEVQVRFCPVIGDVALSVFIGIEGAGVYIDIRIEFLNGGFKSPG